MKRKTIFKILGGMLGVTTAVFGTYMMMPASTASGTERDFTRSDGKPKKPYDSKFAARFDNLKYVFRGGDRMSQYQSPANGKWYNGHSSK